MIHMLSLRLAKSWALKGGIDSARVPVIAYGLEIILGLLVKLCCFLAVPSLLGVLPQTMSALGASALFRLPAGGAHCTSFARCLLGSIAAFTLIGALAKLTGGLGDWALPLFYAVIGLGALATFYLVPVANPSRPVKTPPEKLRMKKWAAGVLLSYIIAANVLPLKMDLIFAASLGLLLQLFTLLPIGYKAMDYLDKTMIKVLDKLNQKRGDSP